jgi:hypothetical protein
VSQQLKRSIVGILDSEGRAVGTGFLIDERCVITCAHVVDIALGRPQPSPAAPTEMVQVSFPLLNESYNPVPATIKFWFPEQAAGQGDIAGLALDENPPPLSEPARLVYAEDPWGREFRTFGFPGTSVGGDWAWGVIRDIQSTRWLQIEDTGQTGRRVQPGYSGAPVWVDDNDLRGVIGMVVAADRKPGDRVAYAIPTPVLVEAWPTVLGRRALPTCPYRGLLAFEENDSPLFFGRDEAVDRLQEAISSSACVSVIGPSGSGKSSVVLAGLAARCRNKELWAIANLRPGKEPFASLALGLTSLLDPKLSETRRLITDAPALAKYLREEGLIDVVSRILTSSGKKRLLLIIDQFEELYTSGMEADERQSILDMLTETISWSKSLPDMPVTIAGLRQSRDSSHSSDTTCHEPSPTWRR